MVGALLLPVHAHKRPTKNCILAHYLPPRQSSRVKRHPDLVRLTGRHPFNCEPPLPALKAAGFITPPTLHYVRNHGAVPVKYVATHN